jgi:hypothetical protein
MPRAPSADNILQKSFFSTVPNLTTIIINISRPENINYGFLFFVIWPARPISSEMGHMGCNWNAQILFSVSIFGITTKKVERIKCTERERLHEIRQTVPIK